MKTIASTLLALSVLAGIAVQTAQAADPRSPDYIQQLQREGY
jgi:hypothetical protein